jgi:hypothetical protein
MLSGSGPGQVLFNLLLVLVIIPVLCYAIGYMFALRREVWHRDKRSRSTSSDTVLKEAARQESAEAKLVRPPFTLGR